MAGVDEYNITAASNATLNSIPVSDSTLPNQVDNLVRQLMADIRRVLNDIGAKAVSSGTDTITLTSETVLTAYADGTMLGFIAGGTNTGAATLNVDSVGAKAVLKGAGTALVAGDITAGMACVVVYDASQGSGSWMLVKAHNEFIRNPVGAAVDLGGFDLTNGGVIFLTEQAAAEADVAGKGQFWVETATPNVPKFTDDAGNDATLVRSTDASQTEQDDAVWEAGTGTTASIVAPDAIAAAIAALSSAGLAAATQAEQETGTSTSVAVTPGRQHFHPGHPKCWALVTVSGGTPTLASSYNITSITDTATGRLTITIATDFSGTGWACVATLEVQNLTITDSAETYVVAVDPGSRAAGSVILESWEARVESGGSNLADPVSWSMVGLGDQA